MFNEYTHAANEVTEDIREFSPAAADCIEQIRSKYGVRAAYLSAIALVICRDGLARSRHAYSREDLKGFIYYEEMQDDKEAIRLYHEAAAHLLQA